MPIYCDESGGVGRGVMTLAAIYLEAEEADALLARFQTLCGWRGEVKGSRIDLAERALLIELLKDSQMQAVVSIALSATQHFAGVDRGDLDVAVYTALMEDAVTQLLPATKGCSSVVMDTGRYGPEILEQVRSEIAEIIGPWNLSGLEDSHKLAGLQLADVLANCFYNRALPSEKQGRIAAMVQPLLESGQVTMRIIGGEDVEIELPKTD